MDEPAKSGLLSVIVPVYNVEKELKYCINSILCQDYENLEVILIDDGSTDASSTICDAFAAKDSRIKVVHQKKSGVSRARNVGIRLAGGEYIGFVDADDWVARDMYSTLIHQLQEKRTDISVCGLLKVYPDGRREPYDAAHKEEVVLDKSKAVEYLLKETFTGGLCNKLYKAELLKNEFLDESITSLEDYLYNARIFSKCGKVLYIPEEKYFYRQRAASSTHTLNEKHTISFLTVFVRLRPLIEENYPELLETFNEIHKKFLVHGLIDFLRMNNRRGKDLFREYKPALFSEIKNQSKSKDWLYRFFFSLPYDMGFLVLKSMGLDKVKKSNFITRVIKGSYQ